MRSSLLYFLTLSLSAVAVPAPQAASPSASSTAAAASTTSSAAPGGGNATVPFYSAPNTFQPTASGDRPAPGSILTLPVSLGAGSQSSPSPFIYTAAASTVAPTGNVTVRGTATGQSNLQPDPTNLQTAAARRLSALGGGFGAGWAVGGGSLAAVVVMAVVGGGALVL